MIKEMSSWLSISKIWIDLNIFSGLNLFLHLFIWELKNTGNWSPSEFILIPFLKFIYIKKNTGYFFNYVLTEALS